MQNRVSKSREQRKSGKLIAYLEFDRRAIVVQIFGIKRGSNSRKFVEIRPTTAIAKTDAGLTDKMSSQEDKFEGGFGSRG